MSQNFEMATGTEDYSTQTLRVKESKQTLGMAGHK